MARIWSENDGVQSNSISHPDERSSSTATLSSSATSSVSKGSSQISITPLGAIDGLDTPRVGRRQDRYAVSPGRKLQDFFNLLHEKSGCSSADRVRLAIRAARLITSGNMLRTARR